MQHHATPIHEPDELGTDRPHAARVYDYYLGGKDNYDADRKAAEAARQVWPRIEDAARHNRAFMHRAATTLANTGFRQFLDIGTGIPTSPNLHEIVQHITPDARIVYVDNDPIVLCHARALLAGKDEGRTDFVKADITRPEHILNAPELLRTLDLDEPVALSANAVLHFVTDDDAYALTASLLDALPSGSALCLTHITADLDHKYIPRVVETFHAQGVPATARTKEQVQRFFDGLDLIDPGIVPAHRWRPHTQIPRQAKLPPHTSTGPIAVDDEQVSIWAGIGIKP